MRRSSLVFLLLLLGIGMNRATAQLHSIVPQPLQAKLSTGSFHITAATGITYEKGNGALKSIGEKLSARIGKRSVREGSATKNTIHLSLKGAPDSLGKEGYLLQITPNGVVVKANDPAGIFYATQTIYQLMPMQSTTLPAATIIDKPRFAWRGLMLDVGRYFYSVDFIKKYIDEMALHKLNTFHWHLTEDHGWRIEIKKYPKLTQIGAVRQGTQYGRWQNQVNKTPHWGYYTQEQIKEVVAYAQERYVNIVPEIEMPGHTLAALVAYPELACTRDTLKMPLHWGIQKDIYCAGNEKTFQFLQDVLSEVADLFPSPIIHIGGDEAPKDRWKACEKCQARIKQEGLKDEHELQSYFIKRIEKFLLTKNKNIIGWDEILEGGLAPKAAVMSWRGINGGIAAAKQKHDVIMSPTQFMYLDYYQGEPHLEPQAIGGLLTLEKVYSYEPVPTELSADETPYIKGVQGNVWCEFIHSASKVEYMTWPRAAAVAEVGWTASQLKNFDDFKRRMEPNYQRYEKLGINYAKSAYNVWQTVKVDSAAGKATVSFTTGSYQPGIRYTIDGTEPTPASLPYKTPFEVKLPVTIKAANFKNKKQLGETSAQSVIIN